MKAYRLLVCNTYLRRDKRLLLKQCIYMVRVHDIPLVVYELTSPVYLCFLLHMVRPCEGRAC